VAARRVAKQARLGESRQASRQTCWQEGRRSKARAGRQAGRQAWRGELNAGRLG
jgi:hypothetical protein